ncbi:hypothetical protein [Streptomyces sp. NPDC047981]|uniref:hypothetical protein n=1 Tax=Streptomyces sp. NPDC047981 TaxID=3154610 RepID=UPI003430C3DA
MFRARMVQAAALLAVTAALLAPAAVAQADEPAPVPPAAAVVTEPVEGATNDMGWQ